MITVKGFRYMQLICGISDEELFKAMNVKLDQ